MGSIQIPIIGYNYQMDKILGEVLIKGELMEVLSRGQHAIVPSISKGKDGQTIVNFSIVLIDSLKKIPN